MSLSFTVVEYWICENCGTVLGWASESDLKLFTKDKDVCPKCGRKYSEPPRAH